MLDKKNCSLCLARWPCLFWGACLLRVNSRNQSKAHSSLFSIAWLLPERISAANWHWQNKHSKTLKKSALGLSNPKFLYFNSSTCLLFPSHSYLMPWLLRASQRVLRLQDGWGLKHWKSRLNVGRNTLQCSPNPQTLMAKHFDSVKNDKRCQELGEHTLLWHSLFAWECVCHVWIRPLAGLERLASRFEGNHGHGLPTAMTPWATPTAPPQQLRLQYVRSSSYVKWWIKILGKDQIYIHPPNIKSREK